MKKWFVLLIFLFLAASAFAQWEDCCVPIIDPYSGNIIGCAVPVCDYCGDGTCNAGETFETCPQDCSYCGDGYCHPDGGEDICSCPEDCGTNFPPAVNVDICNYFPYTLLIVSHSDGEGPVKYDVAYGDESSESFGWTSENQSNIWHEYRPGNFEVEVGVDDSCLVKTIGRKNFLVPHAECCPTELTCGDGYCYGCEDAFSCPADCGEFDCFNYDPYLKNEPIVVGCWVPKGSHAQINMSVSSRAFAETPYFDYLPSWVRVAPPYETGNWNLKTDFSLLGTNAFLFGDDPSMDFRISEHDYLEDYGFFTQIMSSALADTSVKNFHLMEDNKPNIYHEIRRVRYLWWNQPIFMKWLHYERINNLRLHWHNIES
jgi:hypothetical protein